MSTDTQETVTIVNRKIKPGYELEYANWFGRMAEEIKRWPGFKGVSVLVPADNDSRIILYRFADIPSMERWEGSNERRELLSEVDKYATQTYDQASGLETWFHLPSKSDTKK